jgi:hypothetical protein
MISNKKEMYKALLDDLSERQSNAGCNDFVVANTPELFQAFEESGARNLRCKSVEEFRKHKDYEDYKPQISKDGKKILTSDFTALEILRHDFGVPRD